MAGGKTKGLVFVVEFEAEDACVPRDLLLRVQECFAPCAGVKEARPRLVGFLDVFAFC